MYYNFFYTQQHLSSNRGRWDVSTDPTVGDLYLLEIDELWLVGVQQEALTVVADRIPADAGLHVLELLLHILHHALAVQAEESSTHQLWVDWVGANNLSTDPDQRPNA